MTHQPVFRLAADARAREWLDSHPAKGPRVIVHGKAEALR